MVRSLCSRGIWMEHGRVKMDGPTDDVLAAYEASLQLQQA
jgi:ABC-type polysaccharide/polyol phosphate transport system ATPase subunit